MGNYNINLSKLQNHSNKQTPLAVNFNEVNSNVKQLLTQMISKQFPHDTDAEGNIFFKLIYDEIPPKTKRLKFYKDIPKDKFSLNQKDIVVNFNADGSIKTEIVYKVSNTEFEYFQSLLVSIKAEPRLFEEDFYTGEFKNYKKKEKELLKCLSIVKTVQKINDVSKMPKLDTVNVIKIFEMYDNLAENLKIIGIDSKIEINNTIALTPEQYETLKIKMPWIINRVLDAETLADDVLVDLDSPKEIVLTEDNVCSEVIGIIDSGMNLTGDFEKFIDANIKVIEPNGNSHFAHGNMVASLIIAHDELNDDKDNLGNFKVRHFETTSIKPGNNVATVNMEFLSQRLQKILEENQDIKVWNISIGALKKQENNKLLSYESIILDRLAEQYDCLFIVAAGNFKKTEGTDSLCSPADSLNCISVGSVTLNEEKMVVPSDFSSIGVAMHCRKPEISTFGGPKLADGKSLRVLGTFNVPQTTWGTSFSAPKVARLAATLISNGYSPLEAKAAIINLANREKSSQISSLFGYLKNFDAEITSVKATIVFGQEDKVKYLDINLDNVDEISIAWANYANSLPSLGEEYSITNFEVDLVRYPVNWNNLAYDKTGKVSLTPENLKRKLQLKSTNAWKTKYLPEAGRRLYKGKYFTAHREEYSILQNKNSIKSYEKNNFTYAIRIKRLELFETKNPEVLKVGINITFQGENFKEKDFIKQNLAVLEVQEYEYEVDLELQN